MAGAINNSFTPYSTYHLYPKHQLVQIQLSTKLLKAGSIHDVYKLAYCFGKIVEKYGSVSYLFSCTVKLFTGVIICLVFFCLFPCIT